jgi:hypothetical protein
MALTLPADERTELERRVRSLKIRAEDARRARVILLIDGEISILLGKSGEPPRNRTDKPADYDKACPRASAPSFGVGFRGPMLIRPPVSA